MALIPVPSQPIPSGTVLGQGGGGLPNVAPSLPGGTGPHTSGQQGEQGPLPGGIPSTPPGTGAPVQYNIANVSEPQMQSSATTAPAATMAQNAANAQANQRALNSFFGTGGGFAPQYEVDYSQIAQVASAGASQNGVQSGAAGNPT